MKKIILLILAILISGGVSGCVDEPIEYTIIDVKMVNSTGEGIKQQDFEIVYVNDDGYIKYASTSSKDAYNVVQIKQGNDEDYRLFYIKEATFGRYFDLHIPANVTFYN